MPTYPTPGPVDLAVDLQVGMIEIVAGDRADTVVTVSPTNPAKAADVRGARETTVDFDGQRVTVVGPRPRISVLGPAESVDVLVELPAGSRLTAEIAVGAVRGAGRLGATRVKSSTGPVDLEATGDLWLRASHGNVTVGTADGGIDVSAGMGQIRVGAVTGDAALTASHGTIQVGEAGRDVDATLSYGDLDISRALGSVSARTAYGTIRLGEVSSGSVQLESGYGEIAVGIRPGVPAWLDLSSKSGHVRNQLTGDGAGRAPDEGEQAVAVRARTQLGDITVQRAR